MVKRDRGRAGSTFAQSARFSPDEAADAIFSAADTKRGRGLQLLRQDGTITIGSFRISAVGLEASDNATREEWMTLWELLTNINSAMKWLVGDWLAYGMQREWGKTYEEFAELTGYSVGSLHNMVWVCQSVHFSRRSETLSFSHHQLVAPLTPAEQDRWLRLAEEGAWSKRQLEREMQAAPALPSPTAPMMDQLGAFLAQTRYRWQRFVKRLPKMGEGDRLEISQAISQEIEYLKGLKRQFEGLEDELLYNQEQ